MGGNGYCRCSLQSRGVAAGDVCLVVVHPCSGVVLNWSRWYHIPFNNVNKKMNILLG